MCTDSKEHTFTNAHTQTQTPSPAITSSQSPSATFQSAFILVSAQPSGLPPRWIAITNPFGLGYHQLALAPNPISPLLQAPTLSLTLLLAKMKSSCHICSSSSSDPGADLHSATPAHSALLHHSPSAHQFLIHPNLYIWAISNNFKSIC